MARLTEHGLRRSVGVPGLFATAYGNVGSSIYYALGLVAAHALGLTPLVFVFAGGLFALTAKTYAEGAAMFPEAGGSSSFARHAFDDVVSFFAGWALSLDYILTIAISAFFVPHYLSAFPGLHALNHNPGDIVGGLIVVVLLTALNVRGLGESAKLNFILAILDLSTQILLVGVGLVLVFNPTLLIHQVHLGSVPSWHELIFALSLAMLAYTGIETVANMAEESRDPGRQVPKAVNLVVLAVLGVYAGISVVALSALPVVHHGVGYSAALGEHFSHPGYATGLGGLFQNDPVLGIISRLGLHGTVLHFAQYYVGLLAATILFIATNAGMIGISRLSWSLAEHRQLPSLFSQLHPKFRTPWFTLMFFSALAGVLILYGNTNVLGNLYSFGAMLSFTTAHVAVIALRIKDPDRERPYRMPWSVRIRGAEIPMTAVVGGLGTAAAWVAVVVFHSEARVVGIPWMIVGMAGYFYYRHRQGLDPRKHYQIERAERPADFEELEYKTALVPIFGEDISATALSSAAKLIGEDGVVYAIFVLPVPSQLSLEAGLEDEEAQGRSVLESARIQARRRGIKIHTGLIRTRNPGAAIVEEAQRVGADVIYWSAIHAPTGEQRIGPTAAYLLSKRPCRIIIETENRRTRTPIPAPAPA
ncbi:MAG TPA: universal stress protein [Solirubrobacteraceae bacterium]|jgi:APA family basic amino acid/polyamine antiporter|nr:universal stress protein [Solirubrobacteraceae bacterium]